MALELSFVCAVGAGLWYVAVHEYEGMKTPLMAKIVAGFAEVAVTDIVITVLAFVLLAIGFGLLIAYVALKPSRTALLSQKQFIGNVAHELRTPLSIIKTNMEVTLLKSGLDSELRESLHDNVDELDRTSDIINNLLSFNTLQNPEQIPFGNVDTGAVLDTVFTKLGPLANAKRLTITRHKGEFLTVWGNTAALEQIAMNVIKNALLYTDPGGRVDVSLAPNYRGYIELCVADTGIGIPGESLVRVFEPFYRADESRARRHGGSGLGLTIVSELVKLHGGKLSIKSKEGRGTTVLIALPCGHVESRLPDTDEDAEVVAHDFSKRRTRGRV